MSREYRECHKCPLNGQGSSECLKCKGPADMSFKGRPNVSIDTMDDPEAFLESARKKFAPEDVETAEGRSALPTRLEQALVPVIATLFALTDKEMIVFKHKYHGESDVQIAGRLGITKQRVGKIVEVICEKSPIVASVVQQIRIDRGLDAPPPKAVRRVFV